MQTELDTLSTVNEACRAIGAKFVYLAMPEQSNALRYKYPSYLNPSVYADDSLRTTSSTGWMSGRSTV